MQTLRETQLKVALHLEKQKHELSLINGECAYSLSNLLENILDTLERNNFQSNIKI